MYIMYKEQLQIKNELKRKIKKMINMKFSEEEMQMSSDILKVAQSHWLSEKCKSNKQVAIFHLLDWQ